jgi:integrase
MASTKAPRLRLVDAADVAHGKPVRVERGIWRYPASNRYGVFLYHRGKQTFRMAETLPEAREVRDALLRATKRGIRPAARADQKVTLRAFFEDVYVRDVMRGNSLKDSTIRAARSRFACHIAPDLGDAHLAELAYEQCATWRTDLVDNTGISGQTRRECVLLLRQIFEEAILRGICSANPAALLKLPKRNRGPVSVPHYADAKKVIAEIQNPLARMVAEFLRQTGARLNEALALTWTCVDLEGRKVRIEQSIDQVTGLISTTKTARVRIVDMPTNLVRQLDEYRQAQESGETHRHDPWVFPGHSTSDAGRPMNDRNFQQRYWDPAVERAGVPRFTPHGLRHLFASHLLQRGVELVYVARQLGHSSPFVTATTYAHYLPGSSVARQQLDASFD